MFIFIVRFCMVFGTYELVKAEDVQEIPLNVTESSSRTKMFFNSNGFRPHLHGKGNQRPLQEFIGTGQTFNPRYPLSRPGYRPYPPRPNPGTNQFKPVSNQFNFRPSIISPFRPPLRPLPFSSGSNSSVPTPATNCSCVPKTNCKEEYTVNYGEGLLNLRTSCLPGQVCCTQPRPLGQLSTPAQCGVSNTSGTGSIRGSPNTRVTNGETVDGGEFPWVVAILENISGQNRFLCGGSLVSPRVVVTAAHCLQNKNTASIKVGKENII